MIVDEAVRGNVPPAWFWALPGIDRIRAFDQSQLPSPPIARLLGMRAGHVGPGSGTWVMPATGWSSITTGELEVSMLAETAVTGVAMTTLTSGLDVEPVSLALNYFRPTRPQAGNLLARARRQRQPIVCVRGGRDRGSSGAEACARNQPLRGPAGGTVPATAPFRASSGG